MTGFRDAMVLSFGVWVLSTCFSMTSFAMGIMRKKNEKDALDNGL